MTEKKQERIVDKPTKAEVKALLDKNKKPVQKKKKRPPAANPDKLDLVLSTLNKYTEKVDRIETVLSAKDTKEQKGQTQDKPTSEELLRQAEAEQEKAQGKQEQPGQQPRQPQQLSQEQYQKLPDPEKVKILEAQLQQQGAQPQGIGKLTGQQALYGLIEIIKATGPTIQTAIAKGGNSDNPLKIFLDQMKTYESIEQGAIGRFFNYMKMLNPGQREKTMDNIATSPGNVELPKTDDGRIKG
ncbi:hypothetical protein ES705_22256 [subsurface metagenome]